MGNKEIVAILKWTGYIGLLFAVLLFFYLTNEGSLILGTIYGASCFAGGIITLAFGSLLEMIEWNLEKNIEICNKLEEKLQNKEKEKIDE